MAARCLIVAYYFPPTGGGGVQRVTKFIKYLAREGWSFTVITSSEPESLPRDDTLMGDLPEDIRVLSVPIKEKPGLFGRLRALIRGGFIQRWLAGFFFLPDSRRGWARYAERYARRLCHREDFDLVFISAPPYSLAQTAARLTRRLSIPVVLDMRDPWTTNPYKIYPTPVHRYIDRRLEKKSLSVIKHGVSAYGSFIDYLRKGQGITNTWIHIPNGYDEDDFRELQPVTLEENCFHLAFSGTFYSHLNDPRLLFSLFAELKKKHPQSYSRLRFHHLGQSIPDMEALARKAGCASIVDSLGYQDHRRALNILAAMDAFCMILDPAHPLAGNTVGGKVYEYLRLGRPILALIPEQGEAAALLRETGGHTIVNPHHREKAVEALHALISRAANKTNAAGRDIPHQRRLQAKKLHELFSTLTDKK